jgi:tRNA-splicing ligase RtcB
LSIQLERVAENIWEIPKSFNPAMKVPSRIFADDALLKKMKEDRTLLQASNVACLPGLYKYSIALPDAHEGYGFPIGGVAAEDAEEGVISPGGIGYDINCLPAGSRVLTEHGATVCIEDLRTLRSVTCIDGTSSCPTWTTLWLSRRAESLYKLRTASGLTLKATGDHPILTRSGMFEAKRLSPGIEVATHPFAGVPFERTVSDLLVSHGDVGRASVELKRMKLIPLSSDDDVFPYLVKLLGYFMGSGSFTAVSVVFKGCGYGIEELRSDILKVGIRPEEISVNNCSLAEHDGKAGCGCELSVAGKSFRALIKALSKVTQRGSTDKIRVPEFLNRQPLWVKRLFLSSYFGSKLASPQTVDGYSFARPDLTLRVRKSDEAGAMNFLNWLSRLAEEFGVRTKCIRTLKSDRFILLNLQFSDDTESLINLWSRVGYSYNSLRSRIALSAVTWLRCRMRTGFGQSQPLPLRIKVTRDASSSTSQIVQHSSFPHGSRDEAESAPRLEESPIPLPPFEEWRRTAQLGDIIWEKLEEVSPVSYHGQVYDIGVESDSHNFVAEGFVVSNCGVRLVRTNLTAQEVRPVLPELLEHLYHGVPSGVGSEGKLRLSSENLGPVAEGGAQWAVEKGYGWAQDVEHAEERGRLQWADFDKVSQSAKKRGGPQLGTLGSGNHFVEVEVVDSIFDERAAKAMGVTEKGQVLILVHTGSRGFGHQTCSDYLRVMEDLMRRLDIRLPDRELACGPVKTREASDYLGAMASAANFAWANRQVITHRIREAFSTVFKTDPEKLGMQLVYDVCHNIAKLEEHIVNGGRKKVYVHRKGATRAFPAGSPNLPQDYSQVGQPVLIPGSMGTASWVLKGGEKSMQLTFGSAAHGAGRFMSRSAAKRRHEYGELVGGLQNRGILIRASSKETVLEESPDAYKDVDNVVEVTHNLGLALKVLRMTPVGVVKG